MSNAVSALDGATFNGYVTVQEQGLRGMISLRGDLASSDLSKAVKTVTGLSVPQRVTCNSTGAFTVAWMSPDELLILCPHDQADTWVASLNSALAGQHFLAANMSDARAVFQIKGVKCREVVAKLAPVDMSGDAVADGAFRRTRIAQAPAAFWMRDAETIELACFRSQAGYVFDVLSRAAAPGSEVSA